MDEIHIIERLATVEQDNKAINRRLGNLEQLTKSVHVIATEMKAMRTDVSSVIERVEEIERRPSKRYETIVTGIITAMIGIIVGHFLNL